MKTKFFGQLALVTSILAFGFSCGSDGKKSSSQNTTEEVADAAHNGGAIAEPTLTEAPKVENSTLIIRYQHPLNSVTFKCKVKYNGAEGQENSCAVLGELRVDISKAGQYDIYIRAVKNNGASSKPLHVSYKSTGSNGGDGDYYPPIQDRCYDKNQQSQHGKRKGDCEPIQDDKGKEDPNQKSPIQQPEEQQQGPCFVNGQYVCELPKDEHQTGHDCPGSPKTGQTRPCNYN